MQKAPPTPKGFRDILPDLAKKRRDTINKIADALEAEGFVPIETPTLEFAQTLTGKYGEEERLIYKFTDRGERELALRYDLTVPLARFIANNQQLIQGKPFRRYQIGQVFRGENPQHGRYREFTQFDADIIGASSPRIDAELIIAIDSVLKELGLKEYRIHFNDRDLLFSKIKGAGVPEDLTLTTIRLIDKIKKLGWDEVTSELIKAGIDKNAAISLNSGLSVAQPNESKWMNEVWEICGERGIRSLQWDLTLARGLDYYTGLIFEVEVKDYTGGSIGGGGRYDNLIGMFASRPIPAVGFSFGIDRLIEALG